MSSPMGPGAGSGPSLEDKVNQRAGHLCVSHGERVIVWGGYMESVHNQDHYWPASEVLVYSPQTEQWVALRTEGQVPNRCSGAAGCVEDDLLYVVAGFHRVPVSMKTFRQMREDLRNDPDRDRDSDLDEFPDDSEDEDENDPENIRYEWSVEISQSIWTLDLLRLNWTKLAPKGTPPMRCDKTACWSYKNKIYVFGGFGPPPRPGSEYLDMMGGKGGRFRFLEDPSTVRGLGGYTRGWSNQLVVYDIAKNRWEWPVCSGHAPSPRAAHSVCVVGTKAYVFGGRHGDFRLNDLHCLDLESLEWSELVADTGRASGVSHIVPAGRSWQTMVSLETGLEEGGLILYGGFDNSLSALSDCWRMDLSARPLQWVRCQHLEQGPRLWHAAAAPEPSQIVVVGGLTNNILAPNFVVKHHAEKTLFLRVAPPSLLKTCLEFIAKFPGIFKDNVNDLPRPLQNIVRARFSQIKSGA